MKSPGSFISQPENFTIPELPSPTTEDAEKKDTRTAFLRAWKKWFAAFKNILPLYVLMHVAWLALTFFSPLINIPIHSPEALPISTLWKAWFRWDTAFYADITVNGYHKLYLAPFFPLYPLCIKLLGYVIHNPLIAGAVISNIALLIACVVFYQLVLEDFGVEQSKRALFYLLIFPSAFFLFTTYAEALFLCLSILCFYHMRRGHWWLAGICGLLSSLTRSTGILLTLPFFFEYVRQRGFFENLRQGQLKWRSLLHLDLLSNALTPAGLGIFCFYCSKRYGDAFAFSKAEALWGRFTHVPWLAFQYVYLVIQQKGGVLNFNVLHTLLALLIDLFMLTIIVLSIVGPWRFPSTHYSYCLYAAITSIFYHMVASPDGLPLEAFARFYLVVFPAFIMIGVLGKHRTFHQGYTIISTFLLVFSALLFLTGRWMT